MRGVVPIEAGTCSCLLEVDILRWFAAGYSVDCFKLVPFDLAYGKMRLPIGAGVEANEPDCHICLIPLQIPKPLLVQLVKAAALLYVCQGLVHGFAQPDVGL